MKNPIPISAPVRQRVADEVKEFAIVAVYLGVYFAALAYLKSAILAAHGVAFAPFGFAIAKALICAKFVLLGRALRLGETFKHRPLIWATLHKAFVFLALLLFLDAVEEAIVGLIHHRSVAESVAHVGGGTFAQLIATSVIGLLILIPFFAFRMLGERLGEGNLFRLFFNRGAADQAARAG
jgi:hypothetical protein